MATKGFAAPEVGTVYARALALCRQVGETPQLFPVLAGLRTFYTAQGELQTAPELGEQLLRLAQSVQDPALLVEAHLPLGHPCSCSVSLARPGNTSNRGLPSAILAAARCNASLWAGYGCHAFPSLAQVLWMLGYPDQARERSREALTRAQEMTLPFSTTLAWAFTTELHEFLHEIQAVEQRAEALSVSVTSRGFRVLCRWPSYAHGWALAMQGQEEEGIQQIHQGLAAFGPQGRSATAIVSLCWPRRMEKPDR